MHKFTCYDDVYNYEKKYFDNIKVNSKILEMVTEIHPEMHDYIEYRSMVFGYLFERLMNVYIKKHNLKIYDSGKYISNMLI